MELLWQGVRDALALLVAGDGGVYRLAIFSLGVSLSAAVCAAALGVPLGALLAVRRFRGAGLLRLLVDTGMGLPPVLVGLTLSLLLWRSGPLGSLQLMYTPTAMVLAQLIVATPVVAGFTRAALELLDPDIRVALRADGAGDVVVGRELVRAAAPQVLVAVTAGFGRAIAEVGASLMVGGNIAGQTRTLTTAITLETSRGDFALAIALGIVLLLVALLVNAVVHWGRRAAWAAG